MYAIRLPNEKVKSGKMINFFVALLNLIAFGYAMSYSQEANNLLGIGFALSVGAFIFYLVKIFTRFLQKFVLEISFLVCGLIWLINGDVIPGLLLAFFALFGLISSKKPVIIFDDQGITLPTIPERQLMWPDIDFAKLKDGILTIELKNNHLIQYTLEPGVVEEVNEEEFNGFCSGKAVTTNTVLK